MSYNQKGFPKRTGNPNRRIRRSSSLNALENCLTNKLRKEEEQDNIRDMRGVLIQTIIENKFQPCLKGTRCADIVSLW